MSEDFTPDFVECFLDEAADLLNSWEKSCLSLEDQFSEEDIDELFRAAHNLKGSARAVGMISFGDFVHEVENLITKVKGKEISVSAQVIQVLLSSQEILSQWLDDQRDNIEEEIKKSPDLVINIKSLLIEGEENPCIDKEQKTSGHMEISVPEEKIVENKENKKNEEKKEKAVKKSSSETIRVSSTKLEELIATIGELSIHQSLITHSAHTKQLSCSDKCHNAINLSSKLLKEIQDISMSLRMLPLQGLFQRLERISKDIAREQNKKIKIQLEGSLVALDKIVIERITDPLVHIVRNAIDHGIESHEERVAQGKDEVAVVLISARQESDNVIITVAEDGKGLDHEKIKAKALEKDLINDIELSKEDIYDLIFLPGFSTADQLTDISGRGVGMNVVKGAIEDLSGNIKIKSQKGKGSAFIIELPTSLAIMDAFIIESGGNRVVVPLNQVREIIDLKDFEVEKSGRSGKMMKIREHVIPIKNLKDYLPSKAEVKIDKKIDAALISSTNNKRIAFEVDKIIGQQQVVVRELNGKLENISFFSGGTILKDGEPGLILDLESIARGYFNKDKLKETAA